MTFDELIDRLAAQFDTSQSTIVSIVNERQRVMVADSRWHTRPEQIGTTVADQAVYALPFASPAELVHLSEVKVGSDVYGWASQTDIWRIDSSDTGLWFSVTQDSAGNAELQLNPTPSVSGTVISAIVAVLPGDSTYGSSASLVIPADMHSHLKAGAQADLYEEVDERYDLSQAREAVFQAGVQKLKVRRASLVGPRVTRVRVSGRDFAGWE